MTSRKETKERLFTTKQSYKSKFSIDIPVLTTTINRCPSIVTTKDYVKFKVIISGCNGKEIHSLCKKDLIDSFFDTQIIYRHIGEIKGDVNLTIYCLMLINKLVNVELGSIIKCIIQLIYYKEIEHNNNFTFKRTRRC